MVVKTFRGLLADNAVDRIRLQTIKGKVGYRIVKFQLIANEPGAQNYESVVTIQKTTFTPLATIDLTDSDILAVGFYAANTNSNTYPVSQVLIFDNEIFNQDIYIGLQDLQSQNMNYYIELEVIPLDDAGAEYTTLKDMRST